MLAAGRDGGDDYAGRRGGGTSVLPARREMGNVTEEGMSGRCLTLSQSLLPAKMAASPR